MRYRACQFSDKEDSFYFSAQICPKINFGVESFKDLSSDSESAPPRYHVCQFSVKTDNFEFFGLNVEKMPNYIQCFGSNNVVGVAESWVEAEMSWIDVDGAGWRWVELGGGSRNKRNFIVLSQVNEYTSVVNLILVSGKYFY